MTIVELFFLCEGDRLENTLSIEIETNQNVNALRKLIGAQCRPILDGTEVAQLLLFHVLIRNATELQNLSSQSLNPLNPRTRISTLFPNPPGDNEYILVRFPPGWTSYVYIKTGSVAGSDRKYEEVNIPTMGENLIEGSQIYTAHLLFNDIKAVGNVLDEFCNFGSKIITLPFPFIGTPPSDCFKIIEQSAGSSTRQAHFEYYGREVFRRIYEDIQALDRRTNYSTYYLHGTLGYGKSHILAALTVFLIQQGYKIVYLPNYQKLVEGFQWYLKNALILTFAENRSYQEEILACKDDEALLAWCNRIGEVLYFIIDQLNAFDTREETLDSVGRSERVKCASKISNLRGNHILIYSASGNYQDGIFEEHKQTEVKRRAVVGGLSGTEMSGWWAMFRSKVMAQLEPKSQQELEEWTGCIPIFLKELISPNKSDSTQVIHQGHSTATNTNQVEPLLQMLQCSQAVNDMRVGISKFYAHYETQLKDSHPSIWTHFLDVCNACVICGSIPTPFNPHYVDWRYFYVQDMDGNASCLLARTFLMYCMRADLELSKFNTTWEGALTSTGPRNPTVQGFLTEQILLAEIAANGLSTMGSEWEGPWKPEIYSTTTPTLPISNQRIKTLYIPMLFNHKGRWNN